VPGVAWVRLTRMSTHQPQLLLSGLAFPTLHMATATQRSLPCAGDRLLSLPSTALQLQLAADKEAQPS